IAHYGAIADEVEIPIMLYNVPGRTGVSLASASVAALAKHPKITAIKEASGSVSFASEIIDAVGREGLELQLLTGDDALFLPTLAIGGCGVVSVASNLFPRAMCAIQKAFDVSDMRQATEIHRKFSPLFRDLFIESNPVPIKSAMAYAGWCDDYVRGPLVGLAAASRQKLLSSLERCDIPQGQSAAGEETRR
ncbi:MAG: dihydrodipicolinate synthase family protein, partial [Bdellovibrionota bacterium]